MKMQNIATAVKNGTGVPLKKYIYVYIFSHSFFIEALVPGLVLLLVWLFSSSYSPLHRP